MISEILLPEFKLESDITRKVLQRVDFSKTDWKPHPKSMSFGQLANHLVEITQWCIATMTTAGLDFEKSPYIPEVTNSVEDLLSLYDKRVEETCDLISKSSDEHFQENWTLQAGTHIIFSMPRISVFRSFCIKHAVHHRGQMSVYLRMNEISVPSIYGPSADEQS